MTKNDNEIIFSILPTPVYFSKLNRELTKEEISFINDSKLDVFQNSGNARSNEGYILNNKIFKNLKEELDLKVQDYFNKVVSPSNNITPYITQSWLNYTKKNQYHHKHTHPNSLVSGVFYVNCHQEHDKIKFFNYDHKMIKLEVKDWNVWNSESWSFPVKTGDIVLFPSSLIHMVETKQGDNTRISLAFNIFIKGNIGDKKNSTELML